MGIGLTECVRLEVESGGGMTLFSLSCSFFCFLLPLLWAEGQSEPALAAEAQALVSPILEPGEE